MKHIWAWTLGLGGVAFAVFIGLWSKSLFSISESVHFSVNFPTGEAAETGGVMDCCDLGGPWARLRSDEFEGYPPGGVLTWGTEGKILVDLGKEGFLKRTFQPGYLNLSSHWVRNIGTKPYQIQFNIDLCDLQYEWETPESAWDLETRTTTRMIEPGKTYNMDWYVRVPPEKYHQATICDGQLELLDAQTGESLTVLPISIINSTAQ